MSGKTLRRLWGICLMVQGVCAVALGVLSIMDVKLAKELVPVLCAVMLLTTSGTCVLTAQLMKRQKKK